jgi:hypothetical protein
MLQSHTGRARRAGQGWIAVIVGGRRAQPYIKEILSTVAPEALGQGEVTCASILR